MLLVANVSLATLGFEQVLTGEVVVRGGGWRYRFLWLRSRGNDVIVLKCFYLDEVIGEFNGGCLYRWFGWFQGHPQKWCRIRGNR